MEYRLLGHSGVKVSVLSLGTMTFGGKGNFAKTGSTDVSGARHQIDLCLDAGINLFDTADVYSAGLSEEILGQALEGRRVDVLIATKARFAMGNNPNNVGSSRLHLIEALEASLKRLKTDYIDLYQLHEWDGQTPLEETLETLDTLVRSGKVRYVGVSNFSGWHLMKTIGTYTASQSANSLHAPGARSRIRTRADFARSGPRHFGLESSSGRPSFRKIPPRT